MTSKSCRFLNKLNGELNNPHESHLNICWLSFSVFSLAAFFYLFGLLNKMFVGLEYILYDIELYSS